MRPGIEHFATIGFGTEVLYSFVIIICSLMIYFGTKELYELSNHKGIKYFRQAFLFFAVAYFFRSFIKFLLSYFDIKGVMELSPQIVGSVTMIIFMYLSFIAVFYLIYSVIYKKIEKNNTHIYLIHLIAMVFSLIILYSGTTLTYLAINFILLILVITIGFSSYNPHKGKVNPLYAIYLLLLLFWMLNILDILIPTFFQNFQLGIYLASTGIFLTILYKVIKKTGSN